jgi:hypothetical protein
VTAGAGLFAVRRRAERSLQGRDPGRGDKLGQLGRDGRRLGLGEAAHDRLGQPAGGRLDGPQLGQELVGTGPVARILGQAEPDQRSQVTGYAIEVRRVVDHPVHQRGGRSLAERRLPGRGEGEHRAQAEQVPGRPDVAAQDLLGRHVAG